MTTSISSKALIFIGQLYEEKKIQIKEIAKRKQKSQIKKNYETFHYLH